MPLLINDEKAASSTPKILEQLASLPASFPDYNNSTITALQPPLHEEEKVKYKKELELLQKLYGQGLQLFDQHHFKQAIELFLKADKALPTSWRDSYLSARIELRIAKCYQKLGMHFEAIQKLDKAIEKAGNNIRNYMILKECCNFLIDILEGYSHQNSTQEQTALLELYKKKQQNYLNKYESEPSIQDTRDAIKARLIIGTICKYEGKHTEAIQHYNKADLLNQGMFDYDAHKILQHEVGFSADEKIGTTNIQNCVTVVLRDPMTCYTALAHVDKYIKPDSLFTHMISKFPVNRQLDAFLIGANTRDITSQQNMIKIVEKLAKYSFINIKSADIGNKRSPQAIVVNPVTAQITNKVPAKIDNNIYGRWANIWYSSSRDSLGFAFDFTESRDTDTMPNLTTEVQEIVISHLMTELIQKDGYNSSVEKDFYYVNIKLVPLVEVAEKIKQNNPQLISNIVFKKFESALDFQHIDKTDRERLPFATLIYVSELISDKTKPLVETLKLIIEDIYDNNKKEVYKKIMDIYLKSITQDVKQPGSNLQELNRVFSSPSPNARTTSHINKYKATKSTSKQGLKRCTRY
ncbi:hypothetical protein [Candidatus Tisiphia endosymbiont of Nemotelus uliginosus]|uniref:hypothetical protein n=1 Tax=Candidatus Tisiphia endosymbiont of Nemotelus uliginosus TaxID=3077926 RepID=UPI0035C8F6E6